MPGWTNVGDIDAAYVEYNGARTGWGRLGHWRASAFDVTTYQVVAPIPNGTYRLSMWVMRANNTTLDEYIFARNCSGTTQVIQSTAGASSSAYTEIVLSGISVTNQSCEVGIHSVASAGNLWANIDDVTFTQE
jgi:arabinogalactan endo-1,4-beta-galactosidase